MKDNSRTKNLNVNIILSLIFKFVSIAVNLLQISILYKVLDSISFSIWVTIISFTNWILLFDIGIGNGLRNKISEALVVNKEKVSSYVTNAYFFCFFIILILMTTNAVIFKVIDWSYFFKTKHLENIVLSRTVFWTFSAVISNQLFSLVNKILLAIQKTALAGLPSLIYNIIFLIAIFLFKNEYDNIYSISILYFYTIFIIGFLSTFIFFVKYSDFTPQIRYINLSTIKELFSLSITLFFVELGPLFINFLPNFLITQFVGIEYVRNFSVIFRVFFSILTTLGLFIVPIWSATSEAFLKKEYSWIKERIKNYQILIVPIALFLILISFNMPLITKLWVGNEIVSNNFLLILFCFFVLISYWNGLYASILNGMNKPKYNSLLVFCSLFLNIPLAYIFSYYYHMGTEGIMLSSIISIIPSSIFGFIIVNRKLKI